MRLIFSSIFLLGSTAWNGTTSADGGVLHYTDRSAQLGLDISPMGTDSIGIGVVDIDNDGDMDIFVAEGTASLNGRQNRLLLNDGRANFSDASLTHLPQVQNNSAGVAFADMDGDGDMDAIVANLGAEQLLLNQGDGHMVDVSATNLPPSLDLMSDISAQIVVHDVDGDGDPDIFVANEIPFPNPPVNGAQNRLWINDGSGHFRDETAQRLPAVIDQTATAAFGDVNGDGMDDLIVANNGQNKILINTGEGHFVDETIQRLPALSDSSRDIALADIDGDGDLDLLFANSREQQDRLYFNDGQGNFTDVTRTNLPQSTVSSTSVAMYDADCDGDLDAIFTSLKSGQQHDLLGAQNRLLLNTGHGVFVEMSTLMLPALDDVSFDVAVADFNGDGRKDIVVSNGAGGKETLLLAGGNKSRELVSLDTAWKKVLTPRCR